MLRCHFGDEQLLRGGRSSRRQGHCASCHNEQIQASDLSFYTRKEVLDGGERGPAVEPYKPKQSILIHAIVRDGGLMKLPVMMRLGPKQLDEDLDSGSGAGRRGEREVLLVLWAHLRRPFKPIVRRGPQCSRKVHHTWTGVLRRTEIPIYGETMPPALCQASSGTLKAYLARSFTTLVEGRISERYQVLKNPSGCAMNAEELASNALNCDYLFVSATEQVSRLVFETLAGSLKAVATLSVGFNHVDIDAARAHGVAVFNSPGVLTDSCAEIAMLLVLNASRRGHEGEALVRSGQWPGWAPTQLLGLGLVGKRLGILGMGRIGQAVADRARSFGVHVHYHNRMPLPPELEKDAVYHDSLESLLGVSDIFLISAPGTADLAGFLNRRRIALLPPNAIVVNIARGEMIDDDALIEALVAKKIFAAGLDVFDHEPDVDPRYRTLDNVFLTPHIGSATEDTRNAMGLLLLEGLHAFEIGQIARNRVC